MVNYVNLRTNWLALLLTNIFKINFVFSKRARYKTNVSDAIVLSFANEIRENGFNDSQLEIDDRWETCYGELTFDPVRFPDPKQMNTQLHSLVLYIKSS